MKKIFIILASLSLCSCATLDKVVSAPAPCSISAVDEQTLVIGLQAFDTALTAVDRLIAAGVIVPGSSRALQIADAIHDAKLGFQTARAAHLACNSSSYLTALSQAGVAVGKIKELIRSN